jgi:D-sedoheptulose 7-phosphate isomerase
MEVRRESARRYLETLTRVLAALDVEPIARVLALLEEAHRRSSRVFLVGNGGSAATASHLANDLLWGVAQGGHRGMRAISLGDGVPTLTAIANDTGYEHAFAKQLEVFGESGDLLIAISGSGNSPNVVRCVEVARRLGLHTIGFLGKGGGTVAPMVDVAVVVPSDDYGPIEDVHMVLDHLVTAYLRQWVGHGGDP